jgi:hypothetical protein
MIQYRSAHTNQSTILYLTPMQGNRMTYGDIITQDTRRLAIQGVQTRIVLNIRPVTYLYKVYVASYHSIEPHRAIVAHLHISSNHCPFREVAVFAEPWGRHAL